MRIAVLGGGIAGLSAAYFLRDHDVVLFESSASVGGSIETLREGGFVMEAGPDSLLAEKPAALDLARELGLIDQVVSIREEFRGAAIVRNGKLVKIPEGFALFAPTSIRALATSGLLSFGGVARAAMEPFVRARREASDESVASFVTRRFGREVLDRLAQPFIGGIYSGNPQTLSVQSTMPQMAATEQKYGSVVRGLKDVAPATNTRSSFRGLVSMRGGLQSLTDAVGAKLGDAIQTSRRVVGLRRLGDRFVISTHDGTEVIADAVVSALPAYATAALVESLDAQLASMLRAIVYHSVATVNLAYRVRDIPDLPHGTGFLVPFVEGRPITATTFSTQKYPERSPSEFALLRSFVGGALQADLLSKDDGELVTLVREQYRELLHIEAEPTMVHVRRWSNALPEYTVGHRERVEEIEARAAAFGNLALAGAAYRGVGIPDCIASAKRACDLLRVPDRSRA